MMKKTRVKVRRRWRINPRTRVKESGKGYKRTKAKSNLKRIIRHEA